MLCEFSEKGRVTMCKVNVKGVVANIDEEIVLNGIQKSTQNEYLTMDMIVKHIKDNPKTIFFVDDKLKTFGEEQKNSVYLWMDTGETDQYDKPIFISCKRSIVSILTKKYLIASRQVLVCDNDPAVFLTKAIDLPENSDPCHPYDLGFLTANIQNNRMV